MERKTLESYRSMRAEIGELKEKLNALHEDETLYQCDGYLDYKTGHGIPRAIVGIDEKKYMAKFRSYSQKMGELEATCAAVENFVESIEDSLTRRIFRMAYIDGMSQNKVGRILHINQSRISRRIREYLKQHNTE